MQKNILITGKPKSGKSTLLRNLVSNIPDKVGFITNEIRNESGRVGFEIETNLGHKTILAHIDFKTPHKVSKYFVDVEKLDSIIPEVSRFGKDDLLYLDEIGQMELFSEAFKKLVLTFLNSENTCLATISAVYEDNFTQTIKKRKDIILVEISAEDREEKEMFMRQLLKKVEKARKYISEPQRFTLRNSEVTLRSEHGTRKLVKRGRAWECSCEFFNQYGICSHIIATEELVVKS